MIARQRGAMHRRARPWGGVALCALLGFAGSASADEGLWTFEHPPLRALADRHGFLPDREWLDALRSSAVKVGGASGAFVSPEGLVATNHHVALPCVQKLSTATLDLAHEGFIARDRAGERKCPGLEVQRLESADDVTRAVQGAVRARDPEKANEERNAVIAKIEKDCSAATGLRCEVETLYRGAAYRLHRSTVWTDVRLVFVPESRVAFFGGDPDNFVFPRFDLDVTFLRVYADGKPLRPLHFLRWGAGIAEGELVFAAGHPYETDRLKTVAQLVQDRDVRFPLMIASAKRQRERLLAFSARSAESKRRATGNLFGTENWLKAMLGEYKALHDPGLIARKTEEEARLRQARDKSLGAPDPWERIDAAASIEAGRFKEAWAVNYGYHTLFDTAGRIVELANERVLPDTERMQDYRDSAIARLTLRLTSEEPIYKDLEIARMAGYWQEAVDLVGAAHPFVTRVLAGRSPLEAATEMIEGSRLDDVQVRRALVDGGLAAVKASRDPLIVLARDVYPMHRRLAKLQEIEVDEPIRAAADEIGRLRFQVLGSEAYPDATGSLRLSYGTVRGYDADGILVPWHTNFWGLYARSAAFGGRPPFDIPARWVERQRAIDLATPLDFASTLDITGGNSGSPVVNRRRELVGLIFDGNLESLGNSFAYTDEKARAIAVDARAIVEALRKVYGATELVAELVR